LVIIAGPKFKDKVSQPSRRSNRINKFSARQYLRGTKRL
jgi:hypothetical protein